MSDEFATTALEAMRARGIGNPAELLTLLEPEKIIETCEWWDRRKAATPNVTANLLAWKIKGGGLSDDEKADPISVIDLRLRELTRRFEVYAKRFPEGSIVARCRATECTGKMVVYDVTYPVIATACDECPTEVGYTLRTLDALPTQWTAARAA